MSLQSRVGAPVGARKKYILGSNWSEAALFTAQLVVVVALVAYRLVLDIKAGLFATAPALRHQGSEHSADDTEVSPTASHRKETPLSSRTEESSGSLEIGPSLNLKAAVCVPNSEHDSVSNLISAPISTPMSTPKICPSAERGSGSEIKNLLIYAQPTRHRAEASHLPRPYFPPSLEPRLLDDGHIQRPLPIPIPAVPITLPEAPSVQRAVGGMLIYPKSITPKRVTSLRPRFPPVLQPCTLTDSHGDAPSSAILTYASSSESSDVSIRAAEASPPRPQPTKLVSTVQVDCRPSDPTQLVTRAKLDAFFKPRRANPTLAQASDPPRGSPSQGAGPVGESGPLSQAKINAFFSPRRPRDTKAEPTPRPSDASQPPSHSIGGEANRSPQLSARPSFEAVAGDTEDALIAPPAAIRLSPREEHTRHASEDADAESSFESSGSQAASTPAAVLCQQTLSPPGIELASISTAAELKPLSPARRLFAAKLAAAKAAAHAGAPALARSGATTGLHGTPAPLYAPSFAASLLRSPGKSAGRRSGNVLE